MKKYYLIVFLEDPKKDSFNTEDIKENIAGVYDTDEEREKNRTAAVEAWIKSHNAPLPEPGKLKPIYIYDCNVR